MALGNFNIFKITNPKKFSVRSSLTLTQKLIRTQEVIAADNGEEEDVIAADNGEEEDVIAADNGEEEDVISDDNVDQDQDEASSSQEDEDHHHVLRPGCARHHVIENLPIAVKFGNSGGCALCLEHYSVADAAKTLPCQHQFHAVCIDRYLRYQRSLCPTCYLDICPYQPNAEDADDD